MTSKEKVSKAITKKIIELKYILKEYTDKFTNLNATQISEEILKDKKASLNLDYLRKIVAEYCRQNNIALSNRRREGEVPPEFKDPRVRGADRESTKEDKQSKQDDYRRTDTTWREDVAERIAYFEGLSHKPIKTLEDALEYSKVDLTKWEVKNWECTSWGVTSWKTEKLPLYRNNYRVKITFQAKTVKIDDVLKLINETLKDYIPTKINRSKGNGKVGVVHVGDFHIGAEVHSLPRTLPYNVNILADYLAEAVDQINSQNFSEVHVNMMGDFFESISGLNHPDNWKSMGANLYGAEVIILAHKMLSENFLLKINNLVGINVIGGNHDRLSKDKKEEAGSEGAKILSYLFKLSLPKTIDIDFNFSMLIKDIDGMRYILFHGDNPIAKQDATKIIMDYGAGENFTCVVNAHRHTREEKRTRKTSLTTYQNTNVVQKDELKYRMWTIASFFTGNLYSENLGFASTAGFLTIWNNGRNKPNVLDICLS